MRLPACVLLTAPLLGACTTTAGSLPADPPAAAAVEARMDWWREARFGLFLHWGLYAIPAGEWNGRTDYGEWIRNNARIPIGEYEHLRERFDPVKFDADRWVRAAKAAGMGYVVFTTKHHDGFCMWDSALTDWDVMSTPFHRDVLRELADACRANGVRLGLYHSIMDWHHPDYLPRRDWEAAGRPADGADYERYLRYLQGQVTELLTRYGPVGVMWFDGEWEGTWNHERGQALYDLCRALQPDVIVNNRVDVGRAGVDGLTRKGYAGDFGTPEQAVPETGLPGADWESCITMNQNWGWNSHDTAWKSRRDLVRTLCDVASKGGNLLLNVGPMADGDLPPEAWERLAALGGWMDVNGSAIRGTRASPMAAPSWGRVTMRATDGVSRLNLIVFEWPADGRLVVPALGNEVAGARLLADPSAKVMVERRGEDLVLRLPAKAPDPDASVVALDLVGLPAVYDAPQITAAADTFVNQVAVTVRARSPGLVVRYTLDGSVPTADSPRADGPLRLAESTTVTARSFHDGRAVGPISQRAFQRVAPWPAVEAAVRPGVVLEEFPGAYERLPELASAKPASATVVPAIALGAHKGRQDVLLRFRGCVEVPADDLYVVELDSDDGSRLRIDGQVVIDNDGLHGAVNRRGAAPLKQGLHALSVEWFNREGPGLLRLRMGRLGEELRPIPASALGHEPAD